MDLMLKLVTEHDVRPEQVESVKLFAGTNILNPIRYPIATDHLQAKFSLPAELAMIILHRRAGKQEFSDAFVKSKEMQDMQKRIETVFDPEIEKLGFDKMRSRISLQLKDGRTLTSKADERYRGGPTHPLTDEELEQKVQACCEGVLEARAVELLLRKAWQVQELDRADQLAEAIQSSVLL
jgi:2-methylcitrate dehydratase PrpD